jgi:hypothetical protein
MISVYKRRDNATLETVVVPFTQADFKAAGHRFDEWGMPLLSAHRLIHSWNSQPGKYTYWL